MPLFVTFINFYANLNNNSQSHPLSINFFHTPHTPAPHHTHFQTKPAIRILE